MLKTELSAGSLDDQIQTVSVEILDEDAKKSSDSIMVQDKYQIDYLKTDRFKKNKM